MTPHEMILGHTLVLKHTRILAPRHTRTNRSNKRRESSLQGLGQAGVLVAFISGDSYKVYFYEEKNVSVSKEVFIDEEGFIQCLDSPRASCNSDISRLN